jgi:hypothetical protein
MNPKGNGIESRGEESTGHTEVCGPCGKKEEVTTPFLFVPPGPVDSVFAFPTSGRGAPLGTFDGRQKGESVLGRSDYPEPSLPFSVDYEIECEEK